MDTVVLSGPPAVGKTTVARILAGKLPLKYVSGGDMLKELAAEQGYEVGGEDWWDTPSGRKFLVERSKDSKYDLEVDRRLERLAQKGGYVITSYALPWICKEGIKVWLKGSKQIRAERMARRDDLAFEQAIKVVNMRDTQNADLYRKLYGYEFDTDLSVFHLVVDTELIEAEKVSDVVKLYVELLPR
ncbi:MAG TPA: cytidylate kinase family protein [Conexivisphaerales archaeon]|nr:cytidylate kinase family protein [Conexivisphaerales archaeon]